MAMNVRLIGRIRPRGCVWVATQCLRVGGLILSCARLEIVAESGKVIRRGKIRVDIEVSGE